VKQCWGLGLCPLPSCKFAGCEQFCVLCLTGVVGMCKEHLGVALALKIPVFFLVTKVRGTAEAFADDCVYLFWSHCIPTTQPDWRRRWISARTMCSSTPWSPYRAS
jgi:hypothetical protein